MATCPTIFSVLSVLLAIGAAQERDERPSEPAAIAFYTELVDKRVYNLDQAGAAHLEAGFDLVVSDPGKPTVRIGGRTTFDYATRASATTVDPVHAQDPTAAARLEISIQIAHMLRWSSDRSDHVLSFRTEGTDFVIDLEPRDRTLGIVRKTQHFRQDGLPLRETVLLRDEATGKEGRLESVFEFTELDGKTLLSRQTTDSSSGLRQVVDLEYQQTDSFWTLKRLVHRIHTMTTTIDFLKVRVQRRKESGLPGAR